VPGAPAASCAHRVTSMHTSIHSEVAKIIRHPHAMVYGLYRALPGDRALLPPSPVEQPSTNLTPASRRQDHTSSPSASAPFVIGTLSVHRIPPRVRDDREPPLRWDETAIICEVIWVGREDEIFLARGLDRGISGPPVGQISDRRLERFQTQDPSETRFFKRKIRPTPNRARTESRRRSAAPPASRLLPAPRESWHGRPMPTPHRRPAPGQRSREGRRCRQ
jgi:hypothetical protein